MGGDGIRGNWIGLEGTEYDGMGGDGIRGNVMGGEGMGGDGMEWKGIGWDFQPFVM